jgi:hypothetical protein
LVTAKSAAAPTVVVVVDELLLELGSLVVLLTVATLLICVPLATVALIVTLMVNVSELPLGTVALVSVIVLVVLLKLRLKGSVPLVWLCDTNVSLAGNMSDNDTLWASLGPLLVTVIT